MKKRNLLAALLALLLLAGCAREEEGPGLGSRIWETPQLTYGVMEYDKLDVLPWDSGRCEATAFGFMAETRLGYYMDLGYTQMLYADKADLSNWVPLCNKPNCAHMSIKSWSYGQPVCNSEKNNVFAVRDGRIQYMWTPYGAEFEGLDDVALMSMAPDGTDKKIECLLDSGAHTKKTYYAYTDYRQSLYNEITMEADGSWTGHCYRVVNGKMEEYFTKENMEEGNYEAVMLKNAFNVPVYGDPLLYNGMLCQSETSFLRGYGEDQELLELGELPINFSYLSGDVLRFFRQGDGYYDMNIRTGEEVKLADCQLEAGHATVALPNCIVESTMLTYYSLESRTPGQTHRLMLFDGEAWREVALPEELRVTDTGFLRFKCVTSDSVFLKLQQDGYIESSDLYRIDLTQKELKLEFFAHFDGYIVGL